MLLQLRKRLHETRQIAESSVRTRQEQMAGVLRDILERGGQRLDEARAGTMLFWRRR